MDIKARMEQKLGELQYDFSQFCIDEFASTVGKSRERKIVFVEWPLESGIYGAWVQIKNRQRDYIFYAQDIPPLLQLHTKLHELSHIICNHPTLLIDLNELQALVAKNQLGFILQNSLLRGSNAEEIEQEAETLASLIQEQAIKHARIHALTTYVSNHERASIYLKELGLA